MYLRQSTTKTIQVGPYLDATDGVTPLNALTPTVQVSKSGGVFAARNSATAPTFDADGFYRIEFDTTDTNTVGLFKIKSFEGGSVPVWDNYEVLPQTVYDSLIAGSSILPVNSTQISDSTAAANAVEANIGNLDAAVSTRLATGGYTAPDNSTISAINTKIGTPSVSVSADIATRAPSATALSTAQWTNGRATDLDNLDVAVSSRLATGGYTAPPNVGAIADGVWDEPIAGHLGAGSTGNKLNSAASAGDPWGTDLPGPYAAGEAGYILGHLSGGGGATPQEIWEYETRTLTMDSVSQVTNDSGQSDTLILMTKASSFAATISGLDLSDLDTLWFTVKQNTQMSDLFSIIQVANPGGIIYFNGKPATNPTDARLIVSGSTVTVEIDVDATVKLPVTVQGVWDLKKLSNAGIATVLASGYIQIKPTVTLAFE